MTIREERAFPKLSIDLDDNCEEHGLGVRLLGLNPSVTYYLLNNGQITHPHCISMISYVK